MTYVFKFQEFFPFLVFYDNIISQINLPSDRISWKYGIRVWILRVESWIWGIRIEFRFLSMADGIKGTFTMYTMNER